MNKHTPVLSMTLIALAVLAGCSTVPPPNAMLEQARSEYRVAEADPRAQNLAGPELKQASDALASADAAFARNDNPAEVDHLAYLAKQRIAIAEETARQKSAEILVANANASRDGIRLAARTDEADAAQRAAADAQRQSQAAQRDAAASQRQAAASQLQASDAQARNAQLEAQLRDMNARKTDRGMVITIGDVLFDTDKSLLKAGGMRNVEKLAGFFKQYPQRKALVEGFTDSTGSEGHNQELSGQRADAVRTALVDMGVDSGRIATHGYGEAYPVAGNDSSGGRQLNRRVEVVLSDESGVIPPR
jgi:outer membrane protein OmpA-like peptidoglycan-associated protein